MSKLRVFLKYWLVVVLWFGLIFLGSSDSKSGPRSSRLIGPVVRWLFPNIAEESVQTVIVLVRKGAHVTEFAILAFLLWRAFRKPVKDDKRPWSWVAARNAFLGVLIYAITDELHQHFNPPRQATVMDVLIDCTGGALGLFAIWVYGRWRKKW